MKKVYYYLKLEQTSPLRLGNGDNEETDSDLRTDGRGLPFVPASSLTGVLRGGMDTSDAKMLFGDIDIEESIRSTENVITPSKLIVSGAEMKPDADASKIIITTRDGVGLDDWGLTIDKAKYDFQVVETKHPYYAVIEWTGDENEETIELVNVFEPYLKKAVASGLSFGARTSRGYGAMTVKIRKKAFCFPEQLEEWLEYRPMSERFLDNESFDDKDKGALVADSSIEEGNNTCIVIKFLMRDSFNIRVRTSRAEALDDGAIPDSVPLMNAEGNPVIPGTAWAGAFRHHMHRLLRESGLTDSKYESEINWLDMECFGMDNNKKNHIYSGIRFSESVVTGGKSNTIMRNAVDRFTAAPKNTGLFTNQVWTGGEGILKIIIDSCVRDEYKRLIKLAIGDIGVGLFAIGGETGIGRGNMKLLSVLIDGQECLDDILPKGFTKSEEA